MSADIYKHFEGILETIPDDELEKIFKEVEEMALPDSPSVEEYEKMLRIIDENG